MVSRHVLEAEQVEDISMDQNPLRALWSADKPAVNGWLSMPSAVSAEIMANAGWDTLTVDMQHGMVDYQTAVSLMQACATRDVTPLVRVPWNEPGIIMKSLDAGALGVICPMVNTRAEAEALVSSCRYYPKGARSFGPLRANMRYGPGYAANANKEILVIPMIETREAVANLDDILSVPGVDALYVGPADLGLSYGYEPKGDRDEPELLEVIDHILAVAKKHGKYCGIHCGAPSYARKMFEKGFRLATIQTDAMILMNAAKAAVKATKEGGGDDGGAIY